MKNALVIDTAIFSDPLDIYHKMLSDIEQARTYIYLETYRFENDPIGIKFRNALIKKAKEGVEIKLLLDDWGTSVSSRFFADLTQAGGTVKYFKKLRFVINLISANHERDHRKLLLIDDKIAYISSINISNYNLNWREFSLRIHGNFCTYFKMVFLQNYHLKNLKSYDKQRHTGIIEAGNFSIYRDVPSVLMARIRKRLIHSIRTAEKEITIETPYFLPTFLLRDSLSKAAKRGVQVNLIMPKRSDVSTLNILRQKYLGRLHEAGIRLFFYLPSNLHTKMMFTDQEFYVGSANFDYRSFRYQFEIGLFGNHPRIMQQIRAYNQETLDQCIPFNYEDWKNRKFIYKFIEQLLTPFRHFF